MVFCHALALSAQLFPDMDPQSGLWGYRNDTGAWAIAPGYHAASAFSDGHALVTVDELKYITPDGRVFPAFHRIQNARRWYPQYIIDSTGSISCTLPVGYQSDFFSLPAQGLLPVRNPQGDYGYIGTDGELRLPFRYAKAYSFGEGVAAVQVRLEDQDSLYFILGDSLQENMDRSLREWRRDHRDLAARDYPSGGLTTVFIDVKGKVHGQLLPHFYPPENGAFRYQHGLIPVVNLLKGKKVGMIDGKFLVAINFEYDYISVPQENRIFVIRTAENFGVEGPSSGVQGYIDLAGGVVFNASMFSESECRYWAEGHPISNGSGWIVLRSGSGQDECRSKYMLVSREGELLEYLER